MSSLNRLLIISLDIIRGHDPEMPYSVASLLTYARANCLHRPELKFHQVNLLKEEPFDAVKIIDQMEDEEDLMACDGVALGVAVWNEKQNLTLMSEIKRRGFKGCVAVGGYQVSATKNEHLAEFFPDATHFIKNYGEASLQRLLEEGMDAPSVLDEFPCFEKLPSLYLNGELALREGKDYPLLRWETKRGCPHRCAFCEWGIRKKKRFFEFPEERILAELDYFRGFKIGKINLLDGTFNSGSNYLSYARLMAGLPFLFSLQSHFGFKNDRECDEYLEICQQGNLNLEFGLQTAIRSEMATIGRKNDLDKVGRILRKMTKMGIRYEVSLIYGIPGQTATSYMRSVSFLLRNGCTKIQSFPLRLPRHSDLASQAESQCVEEVALEFNHSIEHVVGSYSFDRKEWDRMNRIADDLGKEHEGGSFILVKHEHSPIQWSVVGKSPTLSLQIEGLGIGVQVMVPGQIYSADSDNKTWKAVSMQEGFSGQVSLRRTGNDCIVWLHNGHSL